MEKSSRRHTSEVCPAGKIDVCKNLVIVHFRWLVGRHRGARWVLTSGGRPTNPHKKTESTFFWSHLPLADPRIPRVWQDTSEDRNGGFGLSVRVGGGGLAGFSPPEGLVPGCMTSWRPLSVFPACHRTYQLRADISQGVVEGW